MSAIRASQNRPLALTNARLMDPEQGLDEKGGLYVRDNFIADTGHGIFNDGTPDDAEVINCGGRVLCPALIDMRVFVGQPGAEHKGTLEIAAQSAVAGGVGSIATMPNTKPVIDNVALVGYIQDLARADAVARVYPMAALTRGLAGEQMTEMGSLADAGAVAFTDGDRAIADALVMRRVLDYSTARDLLICQFPEEPNLARDGVMNDGEIAMRLGFPGIPSQAETIMVERDLRLVELTGGRYHAALLSTADAIAAIRAAKAKGLQVSAATAPHYFALNETAIGPYKTFTKVSPPLRSEADRAAVVEGLADGTIDVICSSHEAQDAESKRLPFEQAEAGIVGLETMLPLALELAHNKHLSLMELLAKLTINPAKLLGLPTGRLAKGSPADLLVFDNDQPWQIDEEMLHTKTRNTPFGGRPVQGRVWRTIVGGQVAFKHGT